MSWLTGYRRLNHRYERHPRNYLAFLGLTAAICCYKRLLKLTTQDTVLLVICMATCPVVPGHYRALYAVITASGAQHGLLLRRAAVVGARGLCTVPSFLVGILERKDVDPTESTL